MSRPYNIALPDVFPFVATVPGHVVPDVIEFLASCRDGAPNGSSFAVTCDVRQAGSRKLWLSQASYDALRKAKNVVWFEFEASSVS